MQKKRTLHKGYPIRRFLTVIFVGVVELYKSAPFFFFLFLIILTDNQSI